MNTGLRKTKGKVYVVYTLYNCVDNSSVHDSMGVISYKIPREISRKRNDYSKIAVILRNDKNMY